VTAAETPPKRELSPKEAVVAHYIHQYFSTLFQVD
jgi:hypothetical protein